MTFQLGHSGFRTQHSYRKAAKKISAAQKGKPRWTLEQRAAISARQRGRHLSEEHKAKLSFVGRQRGYGLWMKGRTASAETRRKMSEAQRANPNNKYWLGKRQPTEMRLKRVRRGASHWRWIADRSKVKIRTVHHSLHRMREWSLLVKIRDGHKCQLADCTCDDKIEAHHILPARDHEHLRYELSNGITLCKRHHPRKHADEARLSPMFQDIIRRALQ